MDDVQIVNGLQTSHTIHATLSKQPADHPARDRAILVRILVTDDATTRDQVIRATNRQTNVPVAQLRATDDVQRSIEAYFIGHGWYYDRRKNYYRNLGKNPERIIGIPLLAQAVMAMGLSLRTTRAPGRQAYLSAMMTTAKFSRRNSPYRCTSGLRR